MHMVWLNVPCKPPLSYNVLLSVEISWKPMGLLNRLFSIVYLQILIGTTQGLTSWLDPGSEGVPWLEPFTSWCIYYTHLEHQNRIKEQCKFYTSCSGLHFRSLLYSCLKYVCSLLWRLLRANEGWITPQVVDPRCSQAARGCPQPEFPLVK